MSPTAAAETETSEQASTVPSEGSRANPPSPCTSCGSALSPDQEWCLECGRARTLIREAPDWRIPVAVVGAIILAALVAFAIALINLGQVGNGGGSRSARVLATTATTPPTPTTTATSTTSTTSTASTASTTSASQPATPTSANAPLTTWPAGLSGWTVILAQTQDQASAQASARSLAAGGLHVGVIDSSQHPHLAPGQWMVFTGRYPDQAQAQAAAARLVAEGHTGATPVEVAPPGGI